MRHRWTSLLLLLCASVFAVACNGDGSDSAQDGSTKPPFIDSGDLEQIRASGQLRVLLPLRPHASHLPRRGYPLDLERELAQAYAEAQGLEPFFVYVESRDQLIPSLLAGKGDFIAANLTATEERKRLVYFTVPVAVVREQLVARADDEPIVQLAELEGRTIALRRSSSFYSTVAEIRSRHPGIEIEVVPEELDTEELIHRVALDELDLTVADSNVVAACLDYRDDIKVAFDLTADRPIAWAVRPGSEQLLASLNRFLIEEQLRRRDHELHVDDLDRVRGRRVLRMATRNSSATYFLWRGRLMGFEYELARAFAASQGLKLEVIVPPAGVDLLPWLLDGRADIVAASLTPTEEQRMEGVAFSRPYSFVSHVIVARHDDADLNGPEDLAGRTLWVRRSSSHWETLEELREIGIPLSIAAAPESFDTEEIISRVAAGEYDLTLADSHIVDIELTWREDVRAAFPLKRSLPLAWALRESNPLLRAAVDEFIRREYRGLFYNVIQAKYFKDRKRIRRHNEERAQSNGTFTPYDELIKKYSEQYEFDWRLVAAQMFQESRFDPDAVSFAGAEGLMQVLPDTAQQLGFEDVSDPELAIHAGVKYLDWVRDRFEPELSVQDRMWFALAGYNAGPGHVRDARRLAAELGLNPNRWFGSVENAMLLLSRPKYASQAQHGYCRCSEPVNYVRDIRSRYNAYLDSLGS